MAFLATRAGSSTSAPGDGSRTITLTDAPPRPEEHDEGSSGNPGPLGTLHLRAEARRTGQRVAWGEDVIDNEGCGKKKSKICCIYHKPKKFDESSDEDESSDSDSEDAPSYENGSRRHHQHHHHHPHPHHDCHPGGESGGGSSVSGLRGPSQSSSTIEEISESNAYESMPSLKKGKRKQA